MTRRAWWQYLESDPLELPLPTVEAGEPRRTGLLDAHGRPIMADPAPIGFPITKERRGEK